MNSVPNELRELAEWHGLHLTYWDIQGRQQKASVESLLRVLQCLDVPIARPEQAGEVLREGKLLHARQMLEPIQVIWQPSTQHAIVRLTDHGTARRIACQLTTEDGQQHEWTAPEDQLAVAARRSLEGEVFTERVLPLPVPLPDGYHELRVEADSRAAASRLLVAPRVAYAPAGPNRKRWGVFLPLYALHSRRSEGAGDFSDLAELSEWVAGQGGNLVATLPLLASFFDRPGDESPYRPVSRLFWNEIYLDPAALPEWASSPIARRQFESSICQQELADLRALPLVEYQRQMTLRRRVLEHLANHFFSNPSAGRGELESYLDRNPELEPYARFRAAIERSGRPEVEGRLRLPAENIPADAYDEAAYRYHLYVQWRLAGQLAELARRAQERGLDWYLDLPLGVHPDGYDAWRHRHAFARGAWGGAPPDAFFTQGQCWGLAPLHPLRCREQGYRYFLAVIRAHLQFARLLRIDHVMGLHRLFWIPDGMEAQDGVYVSYPADEFYALLTIESWRHQARLIGENLGTVPPEVNAAMSEHRIGKLFVLQYALQPRDWASESAEPEVPRDSVAGLNTHDMPPFAAYWRGLDTDDRLQLGLMDETIAAAERATRERIRQQWTRFLERRGWLAESPQDDLDVLAACLAYLGASDAEYLLVNLEDLWLETAPQNTPGTTTQRVNWRRKAKRSLEEIRRDARIGQILGRINALRAN